MKELVMKGMVLTALVGAVVGGDVTPGGSPAQVCFPMDERLHNCGGSDGAGLCVFTSLDHSSRWQNIPQTVGFRDWMRKYPGGGYPSKVDSMIAKIAAERGLPKPDYIQVQGADLTLLKKACETGRMPAITYCVSPTGRYNGQRIAHMVNLVNAGQYYGILDNNYEKSIEWLSEAEFLKSYTGGGGGWSVIFLNPGTFPTPRNGA